VKIVQSEGMDRGRSKTNKFFAKKRSEQIYRLVYSAVEIREVSVRAKNAR